jgi:hypothetical protein
VRNLISAMAQLYPEQIPYDVSATCPAGAVIYLIVLFMQVEQRAREVAKAFQKERFATKRELNNLSRLAVDASQVFPPDFVSCNGPDVAVQVRIMLVYVTILRNVVCIFID